MNKTPISIALERQIPEYVRGEYELFVNFIKAYYEFLNQTQQRNLEDIRSIENTLDEFVIRFKKELSVLFPTNSVPNERFILQKIREFYQSRGSKESYQFLFRMLFNKDSDIFYPSTQILRASDGKWVQEKSVFVKSESGNLFNLTGKIADIQTTNKLIHVFCPRVVYYRDGIYEVFIDRAYVQDINIGDKVLSQDGTDYGSILPCPNKYTITTEGLGFEIGQLHYLKSEKGDGSLIKITKIGTGGSIKKVQIISFGLDYDSTFYAKLSNKQAVSLPYRHPVALYQNQATVPQSWYTDLANSNTAYQNSYKDGNTGYLDYGYISKQNYFYFDTYYPHTEIANQNVFYADGTYVGEIIGSFYTSDTTLNVIDGDTAEIKIELGAVAIYPGYYSASDGFISDESYIQDGKYYQLFSYVIKVEQQIDTYYDIVKQLLHPAGLEMYAEYTIKNDYLVSASPLLSFIRRQFIDQEYVTDSVAKDMYLPKADTSTAMHIPSEDIKDVHQPKTDTVTSPDFNYYDDSKIIDMLDAIVSTPFERWNDITMPKVDTTSTSDSEFADFTRGAVAETITPVQSPFFFEFAGSTWQDSPTMLDSVSVVPSPSPVDFVYMYSYYANGVQYPEPDVFTYVITYSRSPADSVVTFESGKDWAFAGGTFNQTTTPADGTAVRSSINSYADTINNTNTGLLYVSAYNQDTSDPTSSFSYEAEIYSEHTTRAIS